MRPNRAKLRIANGELAVNGMSFLPEPGIVELMGHAGYDAVTFDLEHMAWGFDRVRQLIATAELAELTPVVRIAERDWATVLKVLDAGAQGILVPHVDSLETAIAARDAVRYPPVGKRGAHSYTRAASFGQVPYADYTVEANEQVLLLLTIEDAAGLDYVEEIASLEGVDLLTFGPHDLAESMGIRDAGDPRVRAAIEEAVGKVKALGKAGFGLPLGYPRLRFTIEDMIRLGGSWGTVMPPPEVLMLSAMKDAVGSVRRDEAAARALA